MLVQYEKGASLLNEYESPRAVLRAISAAAKRQAKEVGAPVDKIMQMEYRNRLLARVFAPGAEWVLKGGTSTLVRLPDARATKDIDLLRQGAGIEAAVSELQEIAAKDIGDFFRFTLTKTTPTLEGGTQPAREGVVLVFDTFCGKQLNPINVDLVVSPTPLAGEVETQETPLASILPSLPHGAIRLYPLVDQIADKASAMVEIRAGGRQSSRSKDIVDVVTFASTYSFESRSLRQAIMTEAVLRGLPVEDFAGRIPAEAWMSQYATEAARISHCYRHPTIDDAIGLVRTFIDGAIATAGESHMWDPSTLAWG